MGSSTVQILDSGWRRGSPFSSSSPEQGGYHRRPRAQHTLFVIWRKWFPDHTVATHPPHGSRSRTYSRLPGWPPSSAVIPFVARRLCIEARVTRLVLSNPAEAASRCSRPAAVPYVEAAPCGAQRAGARIHEPAPAAVGVAPGRSPCRTLRDRCEGPKRTRSKSMRESRSVRSGSRGVTGGLVRAVGLAAAAGLAPMALGQDSVSPNTVAIPVGDALVPWSTGVSQRANYVVDLVPFQSGWGTVRDRPDRKSPGQAAFFNNLISAQSISQTLLGTHYGAYSFWTEQGGGINPRPTRLVSAVPGPSSFTQFGVMAADFGGQYILGIGGIRPGPARAIRDPLPGGDQQPRRGQHGLFGAGTVIRPATLLRADGFGGGGRCGRREHLPRGALAERRACRSPPVRPCSTALDRLDRSVVGVCQPPASIPRRSSADAGSTRARPSTPCTSAARRPARAARRASRATPAISPA